jgi:hypothetical protein
VIWVGSFDPPGDSSTHRGDGSVAAGRLPCSEPSSNVRHAADRQAVQSIFGFLGTGSGRNVEEGPASMVTVAFDAFVYLERTVSIIQLIGSSLAHYHVGFR